MFDRFTNLAKRVLVVAQDTAFELGHDYIGTEHLIIGLAQVRPGTAAQALTAVGVADAPTVRKCAVRLMISSGVPVPGNGGQPATEALASIGIDVAEIQRRADATFGPGHFRFPRPPFTPRLRKIMGIALAESQSLHHDQVGTEHLLLALLTEGQGLANRILDALDVDPAALRTAVLDLAPPKETPTGQTPPEETTA